MVEHNVSIEVVVSWGGNPLDTALVSGERGLHIGPSADAWMTLPSELLAEDHALVVPIDGGWVLEVPSGAELRVARGGRAVGAEELGGERRVKIEAGMTAEVCLGAFAFFVRPTEGVTDRTPKMAGGYRWMRWLAVAAVLHGIMLVLFALTPSNSAALNMGDRADMTRYVQVSLAADAHETPVLPEPSGETGGSSSDAAGSLGGGDAVAVAEGGSPAPARAGRRTPSFVVSQDNVTDVGPLAVLRASLAASFGDNSSPFTAGSAQRGDGGLANGRLLLPGGPGFGGADMGHAGIGTCDPRHQDCTAGMVGVGDLHTHGDPGPGHAVSLGHRDGRTSRVPTVITPITSTTGALSPEQIRRVVRRHVNEVRFCYEQGLQTRPDLEGRVAVSFIIGSDGVVGNAAVASNTVGNDRVGTCVQQAVRRWSFPSSEGVTGVTYPFLMQSN